MRMRNEFKRGIWPLSYIHRLISPRSLANSDKHIKLCSLCVVSPIAAKYVLSDKLVIFHGVQKD